MAFSVHPYSKPVAFCVFIGPLWTSRSHPGQSSAHSRSSQSRMLRTWSSQAVNFSTSPSSMYIHPNSPTRAGRATGFFFKSFCRIFLSCNSYWKKSTQVRFLMCRQLIFSSVFSCTMLIASLYFIPYWSLLSCITNTNLSRAISRVSTWGSTEK